MPDWGFLTRRLELDALVGGLPASAAKHRAWWSGDRAHVRAWREAGFAVDGVVPGREVVFVRRVSQAWRCA